MSSARNVVVICLLGVSLLISACGFGRLLAPTTAMPASPPTSLPANTHEPSPPPATDSVPTGMPSPTPTTTWQLDQKNDVQAAYIDVEGMGYRISGETLHVTLLIRDVPGELNFNRVGMPKNRMEYGWIIYVDVDNNPATGYSGDPELDGADYSLGAEYFTWDPGTPITAAIDSLVLAGVSKIDGQSFSWVAQAVLQIDPKADTIVLVGEIPGLAPTSRVWFYTYDFNPGGLPESDN